MGKIYKNIDNSANGIYNNSPKGKLSCLPIQEHTVALYYKFNKCNSTNKKS